MSLYQDMKYVNLGRTDTKVSRINLGTMNLPYKAGYLQSSKILQKAGELGINFLDTSDNYGASEAFIGRAIKDSEIKRDDFVIATKTGLPSTYDNFEEVDLSSHRIKRKVDMSREVLGVDTIDLYYAHAPDPGISSLDLVTTMNDLIEKKKINNYGLSNFDSKKFREVVDVCKEKKLKKPVAIQNAYNIVYFSDDADSVVSYAKDNNITFIAHSPLARGYLTTKKMEKIKSDNTKEVYIREINKLHQELNDIAKGKNRNIEQLSLAWINNQEIIPVIGIYSEDNFKDALKSLEWKFDKNTNDKINNFRENVPKKTNEIFQPIVKNILNSFAVNNI